MRKHLNNIVLILSIILFSIVSQAKPQYQLQESKNVLINNYIQKSIGKSLNLSEIDALVKDISQSGLFQMVYAEAVDANTVTISVQKLRNLKDLSFEGNSFFSTPYLKDKVDFANSDNISSLQITQAMKTIQDLYSAAGFYDTKVDFRTEKTGTGITLVYLITEGRSCIVEDISIFSTNEILNKKSRDLLTEFKNLPFKQTTQEEIRKKIESFFVERRYLVAEIEKIKTQFNPEKTKVKINISIKDPTLFEFIFFGNRYFSHFDLIKKSKIGGKFLYLSNSSSELADNIRDHYQNFGFPQVSVTYEEQNFVELNKKIIIVTVDEGPRVKLAKIEVSGKLSRPQKYYVDRLEQALSTKKKNIYYVQSAIREAIAKVILDMKNQGYLMAEAVTTNVSFDKLGRAIVKVQIDEGILTYIRQILFRGSRAYSNLTLRKKINIESNTPLNLEQIEKSFGILENFYKENGFLEYSQKNRDASVIKYNLGQPFADIVYDIHEGPKVYVKSIVVKGNTKARDYVILRELAFKEGDVLTKSKVQRSIDLLEKTGLFSDVRIETLKKNTTEGQRDVLVEVGERYPGLFSTGTGINNDLELTLRGYLGVVYSNLGGKARAISARLDLQYAASNKYPIHYLENRLALGYYEPYLFKDNVRGRVSLVRDERVFSLDQRAVGTTTETIATILSRNELTLDAEKEFSEHFKMSYRFWGFSNQTTFDRSADKANSQTINIGTTGPVLEFDYRDDKYLPTSGIYTRWDFEYSDPLLGSSRDNSSSATEVNYFKTTLGTSFYVPLSKSHRFVWANSLRGGYLKNISSRSSSGVPAVKSFFLGGSATIRGFQAATERIPNVNELCNSGTTCEFADFFVPKDSHFYLVKSEIRFPIYNSVGGLFFYDGGAVKINGINLSDAFRESVGMGLRFETAVGAFVIEVGFKLDRKVDNPLYNNEDPFAIHCNLGSF